MLGPFTSTSTINAIPGAYAKLGRWALSKVRHSSNPRPGSRSSVAVTQQYECGRDRTCCATGTRQPERLINSVLQACAGPGTAGSVETFAIRLAGVRSNGAARALRALIESVYREN